MPKASFTGRPGNSQMEFQEDAWKQRGRPLMIAYSCSSRGFEVEAAVQGLSLNWRDFWRAY
jgi:hypothetical protein